jgi:proline racemase
MSLDACIPTAYRVPRRAAQYPACVKIERFVDSHTEGEPTRVLLAPDGGLFHLTLPELLAHWSVDGALAIPRECLALAANPRAADATVCALVCRPSKPGASCGVLFWNAAAPLGMCGHATIGLARTLRHIGFDLPMLAALETRVGDVVVRVLDDGRFSFDNVPSRVHARDVEVVLAQGGVVLAQGGVVRGDIAWGGNWFFVVRHDGLSPGGKAGRAMRSHAEETAYAESVLAGIRAANLRAGPENGGLIDHVLLSFTPSRRGADARNFVLCPNGTFDRSPCGTGTSGLLATLAARGELAAGTPWTQESAIGSVFEARYAALADGAVRPTIAGRAFIVAEGTLVVDAADPARTGEWRETR